MIIVNYLNEVIEFLCRELPLYPVCVLISALDISFSVVILLASAFSEYKFYKKIWFKDLLIFTHTAILILSLLESYAFGKYFYSSYHAVFYTSTSFILCGALYFFIKLQTDIALKREEKRLDKKICESAEEGRLKKRIVIAEGETLLKESNVKRAVNSIFLDKLNGELQGGYIDVEYLKSLVTRLKDKNLTTQDELEIEELELFILNFLSRQPTANERIKLNGYLSSLIKKLAKYEVS